MKKRRNDNLISTIWQLDFFMVLVLRYKELSGGGGGGTGDDVPYDLVGYITEIDTGLIDADYSRLTVRTESSIVYPAGTAVSCTVYCPKGSRPVSQ